MSNWRESVEDWSAAAVQWLMQYGAVEGSAGSHTDKGTKYITITSSGPKDEGEAYSEQFDSAELAVEAWKKQFMRLVGPDPVHVIVRAWPEVLECNGHYVVFSRIAFEANE